MSQEPKRPYYDPIPAAERSLKVLVRFGRYGVYIVKRPSDTTMNLLKKT